MTCVRCVAMCLSHTKTLVWQVPCGEGHSTLHCSKRIDRKILHFFVCNLGATIADYF